jgi:hypothetical protein
MTDIQQNPYTPSVWGQKTAFLDLQMPSGQLCQVRQPGVENLISAGVLDNADTLMAVVNTKVEKAKGKVPAAKRGQAAAAPNILDDPKKIVEVFGMIDKIVEHMVVQPTVRRPVVKLDDGKERPILPEERDQNAIYTDSIDLGDRMFIFQYSVGGGKDLDSFRDKFAEGLGALQPE